MSVQFVQDTYSTTEGDNATLCVEVTGQLARDVVLLVSGAEVSAQGEYRNSS